MACGNVSTSNGYARNPVDAAAAIRDGCLVSMAFVGGAADTKLGKLEWETTKLGACEGGGCGCGCGCDEVHLPPPPGA
jgi:hypothetical protein